MVFQKIYRYNDKVCLKQVIGEIHMSIVEAILQGILQGVTEFLPVSSSGHLALFQHFSSIEAENTGLVMALLHLGTLVAVFIAFWSTLKVLIKEALKMFIELVTLKLSFKSMSNERRMILMLIVATLPLVIIYPFKDYYDRLLEKGGMLLLGCCFLYTSFILFMADRSDNGKKEIGDMTYKSASLIGIFQAIALLPGVSRSGSTISSLLFTGFSKELAVKFSFILGIPAILGGCLVECKEAFEGTVSIEPLPMMVGFLVAALVGYLSIKMIDWLIKTDRYCVFAYYTLVLGIITLGISILG